MLRGLANTMEFFFHTKFCTDCDNIDAESGINSAVLGFLSLHCSSVEPLVQKY